MQGKETREPPREVSTATLVAEAKGDWPCLAKLPGPLNLPAVDTAEGSRRIRDSLHKYSSKAAGRELLVVFSHTHPPHNLFKQYEIWPSPPSLLLLQNQSRSIFFPFSRHGLSKSGYQSHSPC
jgi:hypothetical protein